MKKHVMRATVLMSLSLITFASISEARVGGGRSSGFRGSRSFGTRNAPAPQPYRYSQDRNQQPQQPGAPMQQQPVSPGMGGFGRGLMGGLAGGFIGSMLFGGLGHGMGGGVGRGGIGLLEILLFVGLAFMIYRMVISRRMATSHGSRYGSRDRSNMTPYEALRSLEPGPFAQSPRTNDQFGRDQSEDGQAYSLKAHDPYFSVEKFKEERIDDFMGIQAAWNHRDLSSVSHVVAPSLKDQLDADIAELKNKRQINKIENIAVRNCTLIESWQEQGQDYATVRFNASLTDYTIDESSGSVLAGDKVRPVKFEEDWTFVRSSPKDAWKLTAIEA